MQRTVYKKGGNLSKYGWSQIFEHLKTNFPGEPKDLSATVWKNGGDWGYDTHEQFLSDLNIYSSHHWATWSEGVRIELDGFDTAFRWSFRSKVKAHILEFEAMIDRVLQEEWIVRDPKNDENAPIIFIGHGRAGDWRELKDHLADLHGYKIVCYETGSRAGHTIRDILEEMMAESTLAILVHTPEDELSDGAMQSRPNVIHETGLFQGRLGFSRAVVMLKSPAIEFSNLAGLQQIRYTDISQKFGDVIAWIERERKRVIVRSG